MEFEDIQNICARHITHADTIHDIHKRFLQSAQILSRAAIPNWSFSFLLSRKVARQIRKNSLRDVDTVSEDTLENEWKKEEIFARWKVPSVLDNDVWKLI